MTGCKAGYQQQGLKYIENQVPKQNQYEFLIYVTVESHASCAIKLSELLC